MSIAARILADVPLVSGGSRRVVAEAGDGSLHVFTLRGEADEQEPDHSFTAQGARALAEAVMAGNERAMTAPHTLRVLAAAVLAFRQAQDEGGA